METTTLNLLVLKLLGFICKPWQNYPHAWWFDDRVVLADLNDVKDFPELIRICMVQYTEAVRGNGLSESNRQAIIHDLLTKIGPE